MENNTTVDDLLEDILDILSRFYAVPTSQDAPLVKSLRKLLKNHYLAFISATYDEYWSCPKCKSKNIFIWHDEKDPTIWGFGCKNCQLKWYRYTREKI